MWIIIIDQSLIYTSQIVSGYFLIAAILRIRAFILSRETGLNTKALLIHSSSFLIFMVLAVAYMCTADILEFANQFSKKDSSISFLYVLANYMFMIYYIASFVA